MWSNQYAFKSETEQIDRNDGRCIYLLYNISFVKTLELNWEGRDIFCRDF